MKTPVTAIFDIGKTNKKLFLFDADYRIVFEQSENFDEVLDQDGDPCEDLLQLSVWVKNSFELVCQLPDFEVTAVNFSAYGASFVHLDRFGKPLTPLYNYLKSYPEPLLDKFYGQYGGQEAFALKTASPVLGSLNSGMQLYRLKEQQPLVFHQIHHSLHLPQYLSFLIGGQYFSDISSVGCHTNLWDFGANTYHHWVENEGISPKLSPIPDAEQPLFYEFEGIKVGIGLHDSSSALIPYLDSFDEPFVLVSTGTWNITLNPFNESPLTFDELSKDCLCYLTYRGNPVKASRLFAGHQHEQACQEISKEFGAGVDFYKNIAYNAAFAYYGRGYNALMYSLSAKYHSFMLSLVEKQVAAINLVLDKNTRKIFVDGGFSKNEIFMNLLVQAYPHIEVYAASVAQASALGAALALNEGDNRKDLVTLRRYS